MKYNNVCLDENAMFISSDKLKCSILSIKPFTNPINKLSVIFSEIIAGVLTLNENNITHGNIKPSNVLINEEGHYKITDYCENLLLSDAGGELPINMKRVSYLCPESITCSEYDEKADVWGVGCVLYYILTGHNPFEGNTLYDIQSRILQCKYSTIFDKSGNYEVLLKKIFKVKPEERINLSDLVIEITNLKDEVVNVLDCSRLNPQISIFIIYRIIY